MDVSFTVAKVNMNCFHDANIGWVSHSKAFPSFLGYFGASHVKENRKRLPCF